MDTRFVYRDSRIFRLGRVPEAASLESPSLAIVHNVVVFSVSAVGKSLGRFGKVSESLRAQEKRLLRQILRLHAEASR